MKVARVGLHSGCTYSKVHDSRSPPPNLPYFLGTFPTLSRSFYGLSLTQPVLIQILASASADARIWRTPPRPSPPPALPWSNMHRTSFWVATFPGEDGNQGGLTLRNCTGVPRPYGAPFHLVPVSLGWHSFGFVDSPCKNKITSPTFWPPGGRRINSQY